MRKYCTQNNGECATCSLANYGRDCHNNPISPIAYARHQAGLTQQELAEKLGVSQQQIHKWENGERNPKLPALKKIAEACGVDIMELI